MQISVAEILSPTLEIKVGKKVYTITKNPSWELISRANAYRGRLFNDNKYNSWISSKEATQYLVLNGIIPENYEAQLKVLQKSIDGKKKSLYLLRENEKQVKTLRAQIKNTQRAFIELSTNVTSLDSMTLEYYLDYMADLYVLNESVRPKPNFALLEKLYVLKQLRTPTLDQIRYIAKNEPWRSYWQANKSSFIADNTLNSEHISLALFSKMYDSVYEHMESPPEYVIRDDDMLDGWMIYTREKQQREQKQNDLEKRNPKLKNATEVFLPATSKEQIEEIEIMNSETSRGKKRAREQMIKAGKQVKDADFVKRGLHIK